MINNEQLFFPQKFALEEANRFVCKVVDHSKYAKAEECRAIHVYSSNIAKLKREYETKYNQGVKRDVSR